MKNVVKILSKWMNNTCAWSSNKKIRVNGHCITIIEFSLLKTKKKVEIVSQPNVCIDSNLSIPRIWNNCHANYSISN